MELPPHPNHHKKHKPFDPSNYRLLQSFGDRREFSSSEDEDYITTTSFDRTGDYLSVGDKAGRLVIFKYIASPYENMEEDSAALEKTTSHSLKYKRISSKEFSPKAFSPVPIEYEYLLDYQSHNKEFDYMKSEEIGQKINFIKWMHNNGPQMNLVSSNSRSIKLWRVSEKMIKRQKNSEEMQSSFPKVLLEYEPIYKPILKQDFFKLHKYSINSISLTNNDQFMLTSDDLKIYLWSLNNPNKPYNIINNTPFDMDELSEVITCSTLSRKNDNLFLFGSSKGTIHLGDMRIGGVCDSKCLIFKSKKPITKETTFFSDILASVSSCDFNVDEDQIIARDYLNLKTWDVRFPKEPLIVVPVNNEIKGNLCKLYESESIFDKFKVSISPKTKLAVTGSYNDSFNVVNLATGENVQYRILENDELVIKKLVNGEEVNPNVDSNNGKKMNINGKILHSEFHPKKNCFVLSCLNCLYIFGVKS